MKGVPHLKCMYCNCTDSRVIDSRPAEEGNAIRRRRECEKCGKRFTTYEKIESVPLLVIKKDLSREAFDADKIRNGIVRACEKRPVSLSDIDKLVREVEMQAYGSLEQEITTKYIGELVMDRLKLIDEIAYVRFASVYRQFKDIQTFMHELSKLLGDQ